MANTWFLYYVFVTLPLNLKAIHTYKGFCGGINGTTTCCAGFQWDLIQQLCIPCKVGYTGMNCDNKCVYPSFGKDCQSTCNCKEMDCDHVKGCKNSTGKTVLNRYDGVNGESCCIGYQLDRIKHICIPCEAGYTGFNCNTKCFYPLYGHGCQSTCKCTNEDCNYKYGCKNQTENICSRINGTECCQGYKWNKKERKCIPCNTGYTGQNCEVICPFPPYGIDCQSICNCTETKCDPADGCTEHSTSFGIDTELMKDGYENKESPKSLTKVITTKAVSTDRKQSKLMTGIGVLAAVTSFIVLALIYTYRLENSKNEIDSNIYYSIK